MSSMLSYNDAQAEAARVEIHGIKGHLVTLATPEEAAFILAYHTCWRAKCFCFVINMQLTRGSVDVMMLRKASSTTQWVMVAAFLLLIPTFLLAFQP